MPTSSAISSRTGIELERHQQRHELVGARVDGDAAERAERPGAGAEAEPQRVAQQPRAARVARRSRGSGGANVADVDGLERGEDAGDLVVGAAERPEDSRSGCSDSGSTTHSRPRARDERADGVGDACVGTRFRPVLAEHAREAVEDRGPVVGVVEADDLPAEVVEARVDVARRRLACRAASWIGPSTNTATCVAA